jgi:hypothetical protein
MMESAPPIATANIDDLPPATISRLVDEFAASLASTVALRSSGVSLQQEFAFVNIVTITNTDIIPDTPQPRRLNRVLRVFAERTDRFARVSFSKCNEGRKRLILNRGFEVAGRRYEFLAYTKNQALSSTAWFVAPIGATDDGDEQTNSTNTTTTTSTTSASQQQVDSDSFSADSIRSWMGDFSKIDAPHKYGSRIGMSFSDSFQTCHVPLDAIDEIADIIIERQNISYCFTEGCGQISPWLARRVWRLVRERAVLLDMEPPASPVPSAFQVRLQGCKGVLVVNPQLAAASASADDDNAAWPRGPHVRLRKSMVKYFAPHQSHLEVLQWAAPERGVLTRQIVAVLSFLGIRDETLLAKLRDYCQDLDAVTQQDTLRAAARLGWFGVASAPQIASVAAAEFASLDQLRRMLQCGISASEPFVAGVLSALDRSARLDLLRSTTFVVERSRHALGVVDETGVLNYGEVFFQFSASESGALLALSQRVFVTKTPCMHQGDVRVLQAVDVPALHHIVDCVVFPQRGPRPHPSEIGGSDLDGDMYLICWDRDLIPPTHAHPATWHGSFSFDNAVHNSLPRRLVDDGSVFDETNFRLSRKSNEFSPLQADPSAPLRLRKRRSSSHAPPPDDSAASSPRTSSTAEERRVLREQQLLELQLEFGERIDEDAAARASILELLSPTSSSSSNGNKDASTTAMTTAVSGVPVALTLANMAIVSEGGDVVSAALDLDNNDSVDFASLSPPLSPHGSDRSQGAATTTTSTSSWSDLSALGLTKMLYIAKENFITNERYHPDAIAQAHLAFADEKGLDCPECTQLAEQFACAVDSVKTGRVVHEYKRPREWPHFMTRLRPTRRSNSILGRLHDAAWQFLTSSRPQQLTLAAAMPAVAPLGRIADPDLCLSGVRDEHIAVALRERNAYEAECEALALMYNHLPRDVASRAAGFAGIQVRRQWRRRFDALVADLPLDERLLHASAWYIVTHVAAHRPVRPDAATLTPVHVREPETSFAWLLDDYLGYIKANAVVRASANQRRGARLPSLSIVQF